MGRLGGASILNTRQAADHLGISLCTFKKMESLGHLRPYRTPGGHRRYSKKMLDEYLELSTGYAKHDVAEKILTEQSIEEIHCNVVMSLMSAIDARDPYSRGHSRRVAANAVALAEYLGLNDSEHGALEAGAYLHDIGKIAVKDEILLERGSLSGEQRLHIEEHPSVGAGILESAGLENDVISVVSSHHERMDGRGYPSGLKGDAIPLGGRIVCVVDSFDAMVSNRPYRSAMPAEVVLRELVTNAGTQFDSEVVQSFREAYGDGEIVLPRLPGRSPEPRLGEVRLIPAVAT